MNDTEGDNPQPPKGGPEGMRPASPEQTSRSSVDQRAPRHSSCATCGSPFEPLVEETTRIMDSSSTESEDEDSEIETEDVKSRLQDFEEISQKLLEELSMLETEFQKDYGEEGDAHPNQENLLLGHVSWQVSPLSCEGPEKTLASHKEDQDNVHQATDTIDQNHEQNPVESLLPMRLEDTLSADNLFQDITHGTRDTSEDCEPHIKVIPVLYELNKQTLALHKENLDFQDETADAGRESLRPDELNSKLCEETLCAFKDDPDAPDKAVFHENEQHDKDMQIKNQFQVEREAGQTPIEETQAENDKITDLASHSQDKGTETINNRQEELEATQQPGQGNQDDHGQESQPLENDTQAIKNSLDELEATQTPQEEFQETNKDVQDATTQLQNEGEFAEELLLEDKAHEDGVKDTEVENQDQATDVATIPLEHGQAEYPSKEDMVISDQINTETDHKYEQQIKDLQETIRKLVEEKTETSLQVEGLKGQIERLNKEVEKEREEGTSLLKTLAKNQKMFQKLNRVSVMVSQEYNEMAQQLDFEQSLRQEAELFAHTMLKEQQAANRQSMILMQNVEPSVMLIHALEEVRQLTKALDETRQELQGKVLSLESQLAEKPSQEEYDLIIEELKATKEEKCHLQDQLKEAKETCFLLEGKVSNLQEHMKKEESSHGVNDELVTAPAPPPPPLPPPPPPPTLPSKGSEDFVTLIKQRRGMKETGRETFKAVNNDVKADAVKEMMDRIKNGIILRPARKEGQSPSQATNKRKSVINEFHGILMDTMKKPGRKTSFRRKSRKIAESELSQILLRRRKILDCPQETTATTEKQEKCPGKADLHPVFIPGSLEKSPVLVRLRQKSSNLQQSRRNLSGNSQTLLQ